MSSFGLVSGFCPSKNGARVDFSASKDQMLLVYNQTLEMTEKILSKQGSSNYPFWGNQTMQICKTII